jgi:hypothetical protein
MVLRRKNGEREATMASDLVVLSNTRTPTGGQRLVVRNYDQNPRPCRSGYWIGRQENFSQTVTLAWEHSEEGHPYIGWSVNGETVMDPGGDPLVLEPCPGLASVRYTCPIDDLYHQISFTSTPGHPQVCFWVQALFLRHDESRYDPPHEGPWTSVCLDGFDIEWPSYLILEEQACLKRWGEILRQYVELAEVGPLDPVELLVGLPEQDLILLQAAAQSLERVNADQQPALANALRESVVGILRSRTPGAHSRRQARRTST